MENLLLVLAAICGFGAIYLLTTVRQNVFTFFGTVLCGFAMLIFIVVFFAQSFPREEVMRTSLGQVVAAHEK